MSILDWVGLLAGGGFLVWAWVVWTLRGDFRIHRRIPHEARDAGFLSVLVLLGGSALGAWLHGKSLSWLIDTLAIARFMVALSAGLYAAAAVRQRRDQ